ncbi:diacylglycerol/lipid kinase family protein [Peribacillus sp. NPDC096448]|uniref:diacylglycerol/lipid kinase family protein n=1 Tax=Peribacillus sp. NPDC096448 TaxID=3364395 RepID=UPI00382857B5
MSISPIFLGGVGLISDASNNIDEQEKSRFGKIGYLLSAVRTIGENAPFSYKLDYDGDSIEGEAVMILVLNGCFICTNLLPLPMVSPDDGLFGVAIFLKCKPWCIFRNHGLKI